MHIYFIRHGETEYNRKAIHQHPDVPLSESGRLQIASTAHALKVYPITALISSDMRRAKESADILSGELGLSVETNELFREVRRPSSLYNKPHISLSTLAAGLGILYHLEEPTWHYKDEENIFDIEYRVKEAITFLQILGEKHEHVAVVSHALIINLFVKYMCIHKRVRRRDYLRSLISAKLFSNGSITTVIHNDDGNPATCDWLCEKINDTSHLRQS
jgi:broad specificity phosphatase PhoE